MIYSVRYTRQFEKEFSKFDRYTQRLLSSWIKKNLSDTSNPRLHGKALSGNLKGLWRYRIGDYRLICEINDDELVILAVSVGHRREINQQLFYWGRNAWNFLHVRQYGSLQQLTVRKISEKI